MTEVRSHYENLKVARNAPPEVIRAAYKALAQKYHPDRNSGNQEAARVMAIVNEAYRVLSDPMLRGQHDNWIDETEASRDENTRTASTAADESTRQGPINHSQVKPAEVAESESVDLELAYERFTRAWPAFAAIVGLILLLILVGVSRQ